MRQTYIWLFLSSILIAATALGVEVESVSTTSTLRTPVERVFSRRKRWLLFPKGSALKFTISVSKRLLALYPKGLNFNLEAAVYYPMPTARIDLIPKRFRKPTTKAPKPIGPTPLNLIGIPGSLIKYRAKPATRPPLVQRIDFNTSSLQWLPTSATSGFLPSRPKWTKYGSPEYLNKFQWTPAKQEKYVEKYKNANWDKWQSHLNKTNQWSRHGRHTEATEEELHRQQDDDTWDDFEDSPHYYSYRGRRDLFDQFEGLTKVLGIDAKSCIMRAMCDSKRFLLPPGYSLIQDILRIVFTFPTISGLKDDYSRIMEADYEACDAFLHHSCPFSVLDWFLNSKRSL